MKKVILVAIIVFSIIVLFYNGKKEENKNIDTVVSVPGREGYELSISETTQGKYKDISIGAGNLGESERTDVSGTKRAELSMTLWINYYADSLKNINKTVFTGDNFSVGKYNIFVKEIVASDNWMNEIKKFLGATGVPSGYVTLIIEEI